jgi:DNA repair exonuclease SbcCD ATPase subunit
MIEKENTAPECPICYDEMITDLAASNICGHVFHSHCLNLCLNASGHGSPCPLCRKPVKKVLKLIFEFKKNKINNAENTLEKEENVIKENFALKRENENIKEDMKKIIENFQKVQENIEFYVKEFEKLNSSLREYRNKSISLSYRLGEAETELISKEEKNKEKDIEIDIIRKELNELQSKMQTNKEVVDVLANMEANEEIHIKDTICDFLKKGDGIRHLTTFVHILQQKSKNLQDENETCK